METYVPLAQRKQAEFQQLVCSERNYVEVERMITVYEKQALRKGRQEGKQEGKQEAVILLLEKKFGKLTPEVRRKVGQIESNQELESLLLAVLEASNRQQYSDERTQETADRGERPDDCKGAETPASDFPQVLILATFGDKKGRIQRDAAKGGGQGI